MNAEYITSRKNPLMTRIRRLTASRSHRREQGLFLGDGVKLLEEALKWHAPLDTVMLTEGVDIPDLPDGVRLVQVPRDVMAGRAIWRSMVRMPCLPPPNQAKSGKAVKM